MLAVANALIPLILGFIVPNLSLSPFIPRQILYTDPFADLKPFLTAPWAIQPSNAATISRIIHTFLFYFLPSAPLLLLYAFWLTTAIVRTFVAFILTRSVGWAHPRLFSHYSLYETSSGFGPSLFIYLRLFGLPESLPVPQIKHRETVSLLVLCATLSWLEDEPWTYACAVVSSSAMILSRRLLSVWSAKKDNPTILNSRSDRQNIGLPRLVAILVAFLFAILISHVPAVLLTSPSNVSLPPSPDDSPLLDLLILSFPRPNTAGPRILQNTISSYLPFLSPDVRLSVFTHSATHPAFEQTKDVFSHENVTFFADTDLHPDLYQGQYLHIAEAFRWIESRNAHWVMLIEDDFPICDEGWNAVSRVMDLLESSRSDSEIPDRRGGFVGTGGSGLIFHRSLLQILMLLMRTHAEIVTKIPQDVVRRPPDVVLQDCLLGKDPLCPRRPDGVNLVITSRLVIDHIGGMASTTEGKPGNTDKWRCGWRHAFHGKPEVEVVVQKYLQSKFY